MVFFEPGKVKWDLEVPPALKGLSLRGISKAFCNISNLQICKPDRRQLGCAQLAGASVFKTLDISTLNFPEGNGRGKQYRPVSSDQITSAVLTVVMHLIDSGAAGL